MINNNGRHCADSTIARVDSNRFAKKVRKKSTVPHTLNLRPFCRRQDVNEKSERVARGGIPQSHGSHNISRISTINWMELSIQNCTCSASIGETSLSCKSCMNPARKEVAATRDSPMPPKQKVASMLNTIDKVGEQYLE